MSSIDLIFEIINDLGVFALVAMLYRGVLERSAAGLKESVPLGVLFGLAAAFAILSASRMTQGVVIDPRSVMLVLAEPFGGPLAAVTAASIAAGARFWVGGVGLLAGLVNIGLAASVGFAFQKLLLESDRQASLKHLVSLGIATNVSLLSVMLLPSDVLTRLMAGPVPIFAAANLVGVLVLGRFLCRERKAVFMTRTLASEATTDTLTQLPNRRMLERLTDRMFEEASRLNHPVSVLVIDLDRESANVTVSIGVATGSDPALTFKGLFKLADEALYAAKRLGRNRVQMADAMMSRSFSAA